MLHAYIINNNIVHVLLICVFSDTFDHAIATEVIISHYDEVCKLPIKLLLPKLFAKKVVTLEQKKIIANKEKNDLEGMTAFLDDIILPSLEAKFSEKYKGFLEAMEENDDQTLKEMAKRLG